ncbi:MAG TPA: helix-turn-helix transcriptional regulator [Pusillimonas sp.]|nr:helix-turn-helix transcriptional regulator [Pusillimonas sp.]MBC41659.1 helix-turn-helix transcriptional regulator [Pusillimonas sp.]HBT33299.1 helix-turn-helix transcriptional regulator [Pusillimonas sp.]HCP79598.1 helix-turn-helix transcriptional regulator [Pusillimonas sp.]
MMSIPVLLITQDDNLWRHWRQINTQSWAPARGHDLSDLERWRQQNRSLVFMDRQLPRLPDWDDSDWKKHFHGLQVIVASIRPSDHEASRTFAAGSSGYLHAYSPIPVLENALQSVNAGSVWMGRSLVNQILKEIDRRVKPGLDAKTKVTAWADSLTAREKEVAQRAAVGRSNQEIADELGITERTVRAHMTAVFEKLKVNDRLTLALKVHGISAS